MIRVLLVDDHDIVRAAIKSLLKDAKDINVVGESSNGEDAIRVTREVMPDVVIMDLNMPGMGGFEAVMRLLQIKPAPKILVLSTYTSGLVPARLLDLGASGYLSKRANREEMICAIQAVNAGKRYIDQSMEKAIASLHIGLQNNPHPMMQLSERELQVLIMIAHSVKRHEIAKNLYLSKKTIDGYVSKALKKLNANTEAEAVRIAIESGLINTDG
ncbi:MAG TPA: response regulator [Gammaproteobacteria bacterium]|nr:response regulator [Gammaproteobacteria bacterium]